VTAGELRLRMVELAIEGNGRFMADAREVRRAGPTYTVDTLRELHAEGQDDIVVVLGSDALADMPKWREPEELPRLARIVIAEKAPGAETGGFERVDMPLVQISSTLIRDRVSRGQPIRYLVPPAVEAFIRKHRLYASIAGESGPAAV
jgi:nicotinate-nucleotide adenylyltransferase